MQGMQNSAILIFMGEIDLSDQQLWKASIYV